MLKTSRRVRRPTVRSSLARRQLSLIAADVGRRAVGSRGGINRRAAGIERMGRSRAAVVGQRAEPGVDRRGYGAHFTTWLPLSFVMPLPLRSPIRLKDASTKALVPELENVGCRRRTVLLRIPVTTRSVASAATGGSAGTSSVKVSQTLGEEHVGLVETEDGEWDVYFGPLRLGRFHERTLRIEDALGRLALSP